MIDRSGAWDGIHHVNGLGVTFVTLHDAFGTRTPLRPDRIQRRRRH